MVSVFPDVLQLYKMGTLPALWVVYSPSSRIFSVITYNYLIYSVLYLEYHTKIV